MATFIDPAHASEREVLEDISYFEMHDLPMSPPETPPMKQNARTSLREPTPMHSHLANFYRSPPGSPHRVLKRTLSDNIKAAFADRLPLTPPSTPPPRFGIHSTLARTMSSSVHKGHQMSIFASKSRPTIVTIDVRDSSPSRRGSLRRSSSYSSDSAGPSSKGPLDRVRDYTARSTDSRYPIESPLAPPAYLPPPNTPANADAIYTTTTGLQIYGVTERGAGPQDNDPFNPFPYTGTTQHPNHSRASSQLSNGLWQGNGNGGLSNNDRVSNLPSPGGSQIANVSVVDLEKARRRAVPDHPRKKRGFKKTLICCIIAAILLVVGVVVALIIIVRLRYHFLEKHHHHQNK